MSIFLFFWLRAWPPYRPTNYTLGVGTNKITLAVVDVSHTEPWVINTYTIYITRRGLADNEPPFRPHEPHQVCSLKQVR